MKTSGSHFEDDEAGEELSFPNNGYIPPAIPNGDQYQIQFLRAERTFQWNRQIVFLWFRLLTPGDSFGKEFYMTCSIPPNGRWSPSHKYWMVWVLAAGQRPGRKDRLSTSMFKNKVFRARMRVVTKTAKQLQRTPEQRYSVVDELLERLTGQK